MAGQRTFRAAAGVIAFALVALTWPDAAGGQRHATGTLAVAARVVPSLFLQVEDGRRSPQTWKGTESVSAQVGFPPAERLSVMVTAAVANGLPGGTYKLSVRRVSDSSARVYLDGKPLNSLDVLKSDITHADGMPDKHFINIEDAAAAEGVVLQVSVAPFSGPTQLSK